MNADMLTDLIAKIRSDTDYLNDRRVLHENYEWLECFWRYKYLQDDNSFDSFIPDKANYFWQRGEIKVFAKEFASIECVGSNKKAGYEQNEVIANATMYLNYHCDLFAHNVPNCAVIHCRNHKTDTGLCTTANGRQWCVIDNDNHFAFKALMYVVRQISNNLFHGHKMTLDDEQFQRDKILVSISARTTLFLIDNLVVSGG